MRPVMQLEKSKKKKKVLIARTIRPQVQQS